jgi:hypothetical protein
LRARQKAKFEMASKEEHIALLIAQKEKKIKNIHKKHSNAFYEYNALVNEFKIIEKQDIAPDTKCVKSIKVTPTFLPAFAFICLANLLLCIKV